MVAAVKIPTGVTLTFYPINTSRGVVEHGGALSSRVVLGQPLEAVVHQVVGVEHLVHREVPITHHMGV